ncbi:MAG: hypothetical protein WCX82_03470 [archaeon]
MIIAIKESVKLYSHYAVLFNQFDGGKRLQFCNSEKWVEKLIN